ncbi:MAG: hypothetical protein QI197_04625 [Candidatus Korarchaeota archaeon]|nr:hypothetical protein [Candidatus Korarchaeota archaeon]
MTLKSIYLGIRNFLSLLRRNLVATIVSLLLILFLAYYLFIWLGTDLFTISLIVGLPILVIAVAIMAWHLKRESSYLYRMRRSLNRYVKLLKKGRESVYRNLDARNILDAFEKAPGIFYVLYGELNEGVITKEFEHKGVNYIIPDRSAERIMRHFVSTLEGSKGAFDYRTGLSSFFIIRTEDELIPPEAYDKVKVWIKGRAKMMHAAKDGEFDLPIWDVEDEDIQRKMGLMMLISGIDIPKRIIRDCRMAREQYIILRRMESMKDVKKLAGSVLEDGDLDEQAEQLADTAYEIREVEAKQVLDPGKIKFYSLEDAIRRTFPELGGNERRRLMEAIDRAASKIISSLLGSEVISPEEVRTSTLERIEEELRGKFPDGVVSFIIEAVKRSEFGERVVRRLGEDYARSLAERAKERAMEAAPVVEGSRTFGRIFSIIIKNIGGDRIPTLRKELENLVEELRAYLNEEFSNERSKKKNEKKCEERDSERRDFEELIRALEELLRCLEELESALDLENIERISEAISKVNGRARTVNELIQHVASKYAYEDGCENAREEDMCSKIRTDLLSMLRRIEELKHNLQIISGNLLNATSPLGVRSREEISRDLEGEIDRWIPSKDLIKDEILKSIEELYRKDLKLYISLVVGNPLKMLYYKLKGVRNR